MSFLTTTTNENWLRLLISKESMAKRNDVIYILLTEILHIFKAKYALLVKLLCVFNINMSYLYITHLF